MGLALLWVAPLPWASSALNDVTSHPVVHVWEEDQTPGQWPQSQALCRDHPLCANAEQPRSPGAVGSASAEGSPSSEGSPSALARRCCELLQPMP